MLEAILNRLMPASERQKLQAEAEIESVTAKALRTCTWTDEEGNTSIVHVIGINKDQQLALLTKKQGDKGAIWIAKRDQSGKPGTWLWTTEQLEAAQRNATSRRIKSKLQSLIDQPIEVAPIHEDRRAEILAIGKYIGKSDEEVIAQLAAEGFDTTFPENYRTTWNPYEGATTEPLTHQEANTEPILNAIKHLREKIRSSKPQE